MAFKLAKIVDSDGQDLSTLLGIGLAFAMIMAAILFSGSGAAYIDFPSALIVLGGTLAIVIACYSFDEFLSTFEAVGKTVLHNLPDLRDEVEKLLNLSDLARKNGILSLQNHPTLSAASPFLEKGLSHAMDGMEPARIESIMTQATASMAERHRKSVAILKKCAEVAPGMGLIGTLLGLVQMLKSLNDPSSIGPAMAVALLTTLYGAVLSFLVFTPLATKLERNSRREIMLNHIYIKGVLSIAALESPRTLEALLNTILPPSSKAYYTGSMI